MTDEVQYETGKGGIRLALSTEYPLTRADVVEGNLNPDDFKIEIINSKGVIFKRWKTYADYKNEENSAFVMNAGGPYRIRATYGDSLASGFNAFFFKGEQEFTVVPQETVNLNVVCRMANVKVAVVYGENIRNEYVDYSATIKNSKGSLTFGKDCKEAGYIPVEDLDITMTLTDANGKNWYFKNSSKVSVSPGDFLTLNLDTKPVPEYGVGIEVGIDRTTNDSTIVIEIPTYLLPAPAPVIVLDGFDAESGSISVVEGTAKKAVVNMDVFSGIASCVMTVNSDYLVQDLQWPSMIDFLNMETGTRNILDQYGVKYQSVTAGAVLASIEFTDLCRKLKYNRDESSNAHSFTVTVTDTKGKSIEKTVSIIPAEANKSIAFSEGDVWATKLYATLSTTDGDVTLLVPQVSLDGKVWTTPEYNEAVSGSSKSVIITGLLPNTAYSVRASYYNNSSEPMTLTTEAATQVSNSDFEEWSSFIHEWTHVIPIPKKTLEWYRPYSSENTAWWDVNSRSTMIDYTSLAGATNSRVFFTGAYTQVDPYSGSRSAMIFTTRVWSTEYTATKAGELFIGRAINNTPKGDGNGGQHEYDGHPFTSRPSAVKFAYKYVPVNGETFYVEAWVKDASGKILGSFTNTAGTASESWKTMTIRFDYGNNLSTKAASIYISFKSSSATQPSYNENVSITVADNKSYSGCNIGSILYLDDVELIYE